MDNFYKVLKILIDKLEGIDFALLGTFNLFTQGISVKPHDLDLITDDGGIEKIARVFGSKITRKNFYLETGFLVNGVEVHIVSDKNNPLRGLFRDSMICIRTKSLKLPCLSLKSELLFYQMAGRKKDRGKIELILEKLPGKK